ncbi:MAG: GNAT family N-acetyltransferase [Thermoplasmata archaeon]|nr:GNAT family N-acetyltransferase [Thermoplasmata archaeon]
MEIKDIEVELVKSWPLDEIVELYKVGGWWKDHYDPEGLDPLIKGSFAFAIAVDRNTGTAVGMGRAISDGVSDAYIQDVAVQESLRGKGIGSLIIKTLVDHLRKHGIGWIGLIAEQDSRPFYEKIGFNKFVGEPMLYKGKE